MPEPIDACDVHVWYRRTDAIGPDEYAELLAVLPDDERDQASRFVFEPDRLAFAAAHALLRRTLSRYEDVAPVSWLLDRTTHGKPVLGVAHTGCRLQFNLSHTRGLVACAVSRGTDVGIDVEALDPRVHVLDLAARFFSPTETAGIRECADEDRPLRFVELWTLKESYVKAIGEGLSHPLDSFSFVLSHPASIQFEAPKGTDPAGWQFALYSISEVYRMAVAARRAPGAAIRLLVREQLPTSGGACILARFTY